MRFAYLKFLRLISHAGEVSLSEFHTRFFFGGRRPSKINNSNYTSVTSPQHLNPPHHVIIYGTHVFPQLRQFWDTFRQDLTSEGPYKVSIGGMRLRLQELQEEDTQAQMIRAEKLEKMAGKAPRGFCIIKACLMSLRSSELS